MKRIITGIALVALSSIAMADIIPFSEDFTGSKTWGFDSENAIAGGNVSAIGGTNALAISPNSWATGDGVSLIKNADNSGAASGEGSFTFSYKINPWALTTSTWNINRMVEIGTASGSGSTLGTGGMLLSMRLAKNPAAQQAQIHSQSRILFSGASSIIHTYNFDGADTDGFIDVSIELDLNKNAGTGAWTLDSKQTTTYAGNTLEDTTTFTAPTAWTGSWTGLQDIDAYKLGLIRDSGADLGGTVLFDDFEVASIIPEPASLSLLGLGVLLTYVARRKRASGE